MEASVSLCVTMTEPVIKGLSDSHAHLTYVLERMGPGHLERIESAYREGSALILDVGVDFDDYPARKAKFGSLPFVRLAAGIWPDTASMKSVEERVSVLEGFIRDPACAALGECGLDYHWMHGTREEQAALFRAQADLALRYGKPLIVHSRDAHEDTLAIVRTISDKVPVIIHCFGYGPDEARSYLEAGCWISCAGNISYKKSDALRAACRIVPDDRLLLETDAPYMCPEPRRGKNSSPLDIERTYELVAKSIRGLGVDFLAELVRRNLYGILDPRM